MPFTLKKRFRIIYVKKPLVRKKTHKFETEVPISIEHYKRLNGNNRYKLCKDAIVKYMYHVLVAFNILEDGESPPPVWTKSTGHLIFDVKMEFTRKSIWVKDGHRTQDPETSSYAGVVSRESIHIKITTEALQVVDVLADGIRYLYL